MELFILTENKSQSEYTEPRYWASADDSSKIVGVFSTREKAEAEKQRLEALCEEGGLDEDDGDDEEYVFYEILKRVLDETDANWLS